MATGKKTGGRVAGTPNVATLTLREQVEQVSGGPLPVLLATVGRKAMDAGDHQLAVTAFAKAMSHVYPRIPQAEEKGVPFPAPVINITRQVICDKCGHDPSNPDRITVVHRIVRKGDNDAPTPTP